MSEIDPALVARVRKERAEHLADKNLHGRFLRFVELHDPENDIPPARLRAPYNRPEWRALSPEERREHMRAAMIEHYDHTRDRAYEKTLERAVRRAMAEAEVAARRAARKATRPAPKVEPAPVPASVELPADWRPSGRYVLPCSVDGCDRWLDARPHKPVARAVCPIHRDERRRDKANAKARAAAVELRPLEAKLKAARSGT